MSHLQIYLARNNVQAGPYSLEQVNTMLASGEVELNDLMWHEGMDNWQRVGTMTNEMQHYAPNLPHATPSAPVDFTKNVDFTHNDAHTQPNPTGTQVDTQNRTTVERLYGKAPAQPTPSPTANTPNANKPNLNKGAKEHPANRINTNHLASIGSRVLATLVDQVLAIACLIPLFAALGFSFKPLLDASTDYAAMTTLMESLPEHLVIMSSLMFLALIVIQVIMLLKRGQSLGKLATGVRILDVNTHKIPNATNLILIRTILTNFAYNLGFLGVIIALADLTVLLFDKQRRSLHDKLAKTYVVKADERQLAYKKPSNNKKPNNKP